MWLIFRAFPILAALLLVFPIKPAFFPKDFIIVATVTNRHAVHKTAKI
jgi:hypothetical protein